ncbi:MAG: hypothetical protein GX817_05030 [Elusimicrobia bacterium]|nr:hypothetical protein [Elusimicrobiota bacterium]
MKKLLLAFFLLFSAYLPLSAFWEEWELGGELGLSIGAGMKSGRVLSPALMFTGTRQMDERKLELGVGMMFGSKDGTNYNLSDVEFEWQDVPSVLTDADKKIREKIFIIPTTANLIYDFYESFYIGAGLGLYHVFYTEEPAGPWRVNPSGEPGAKVKSRASTSFGLQQMVGMEIFPLSDNWSWFVGLKSFFIFGHRIGNILGVNIGGKVRYTW